MCARARFFVVNFSLTAGRLAEFGFLGVQILNRKTIPFFEVLH